MVQSCLKAAEQANMPIDALRGTALFDEELDRRFSALPDFEKARDALRADHVFVDRFGEVEAERIALQFLYNYASRAESTAFEERSFDQVWNDFATTLDDPNWHHMGVANVLAFGEVDMGPLEFGSEVRIIGRARSDLAELGMALATIDALYDRWTEEHPASSYVLVARSEVPKTPDTVVMGDLSPSVKAWRCILALRLAGIGGIGLGRMWIQQVDPFCTIGGRTGIDVAQGAHPAALGELTPDRSDLAIDLFHRLGRLEETRYANSPGNLELALRAFTGVFNRRPAQSDSQIVDATTSLEALIGATPESTFRVASRVANILGGDDGERVELFRTVKLYYAIRSKSVHGTPLQTKEHRLLDDHQRFIHVVRRLLVAWIKLADNEQPFFANKKEFDALDELLLNSEKRTCLQRSMGLVV